MGWVDKVTAKNGRIRYKARYRDRRGKLQFVGSYTRRRDAERAAEDADTKSRAGRVGDPTQGRQTFREYVTEKWLPFHVVEASTRQGYTYQINKHLLPWFADMKMVDLRPHTVREWITHLQGVDPPISAKTIKNLKNLLSAICTTAINDEVIFLHPCRGVKTPTVPVRRKTIITPEQFDVVYDALPDGDLQLLVETDIETGLRWGELTELRPHDFSQRHTVITVSRAVVHLNPKFHPQGRRFLVKEYPKDGEPRTIQITTQLAAKIAHHIQVNNIADDQLIFEHVVTPRRVRPAERPDPAALGTTAPNAAGRTYRHGTTSAYTAGQCRCQPCRDAIADYRATRRASGKDLPNRIRAIPGEPERHVSRDWFRVQVWQPALTKANIGIHVRIHDLRHAHASWLLAGGTNIQVVKERLGHASITTTEKYLHTLPEAQSAAVNAFTAIRNRGKRT
jgi:integrase